MKIFVTGGTGFVGSALLERLAPCFKEIVSLIRKATEPEPNGSAEGFVSSQWAGIDAGYGVVVHLAARVHVMNDTVVDPLAAFRHSNVESTLALAQQAAAAGVKRFIFISSVKVNGESTSPGQPFRADDKPAPQDPYGISKMEAEIGLREIAQQTGMEVVIIRPPLVYGPGVKANFASMVRWLQRGVPLPFGAIDNRRSLVALDNLVDLIIRCIDHPGAANQTFMVSDGEDVSTTELLRKMGAALGRPARLVPVPQRWMEWGAGLLGKQDVAQRLFSSLQVDIGLTRELLGWTPPLTMDEGLAQVARHVQGN